MAAITFASQLQEDGSLPIPAAAVQELGLHPGDVVQVSVEATDEANGVEEANQAALQAKFERFFEKLDTLTFEKPSKRPNKDQAEASFAEIMDEKYRRLGFKE